MRSIGLAGKLFLLLTAAGGLIAEEAAGPPIRLKSGRVPRVQRAPAYLGRFHFLLRFNVPPGLAERTALEARGARVVSYVPENTWICTIPDGFDWATLDLAEAVPIEPSNKLSSLVLDDSAVLVEFHSDVEPPLTRALIIGAGLEILDHPDLAPSTLMVHGDLAAIESLATLDEVAYILPASDQLIAGEPVVACLGGVQQTVPVAANLASRFGEGWDGPGLGKADLKYWLGPLTTALDQAAAAEIARALDQWSAAAAIRFSPAAAPAALRSLDIWFANRDHGDGFRFDGRGGVLAHTFYPPPNAEPIAGDLHLDIEESWRIGLDVDLYSVVLHELGHALGLGHNDDPNSVMYPYYRRVNALRPADITEIRKLYAATAGAVTPPAIPPPAPTPALAPTPLPTPPPVKDTVVPVLTVTAPPTATTASAVVIRGLATDNIAIAAVVWQTAAGASGSTAGLPQFATTPIPLNRGINRITLRARDAAGNETYRTVPITRR